MTNGNHSACFKLSAPPSQHGSELTPGTPSLLFWNRKCINNQTPAASLHSIDSKIDRINCNHSERNRATPPKFALFHEVPNNLLCPSKRY